MHTPTTRSEPSVLSSVLYVVCAVLVATVALKAPLQPRQQKPNGAGVLKLTLLDEETGKPTPARVELLDEQGKGYVPDDALPVWNGYWPQRNPATQGLSDAMKNSVKKVNYSGDADQFYCGGKSQLSLPGGTYKVRVLKGNEYRIASQEIHVVDGETIQATVALKRWANPTKDAWYSADTHLHIGRPDKQLNPMVSQWMQAEDIHIAGLLQWGDATHFRGSPQYAFGAEGVYREGDYLLVSGQENPRSMLGHVVILGGQSPINFPEQYTIYRNFWQEARHQDAIAGACHGGLAELPIDLPSDLISVIEVLQFGSSNYASWYAGLNSGFHLTPIAGTDTPTTRSFPGRDRFYAHVAGPLSHESWLAAIRQGKTFVTNGPLLDFHVNGQEIGSEIDLKEPASVLIEGHVRFDPEREDIKRVEVIENGEVIQTFERKGDAAEVAFQFKHPVAEAGWLAVRASGVKLEPRPAFHNDKTPQALAHSGAIYVGVGNHGGLAANRQAKLADQNWLAQLDALAKRVADNGMLTRIGIEGTNLRKNREELLRQIEAARKFYLERSQ